MPYYPNFIIFIVTLYQQTHIIDVLDKDIQKLTFEEIVERKIAF